MRNTICQVCLAPDDAETMLLCDTCDHGYHIDCLDPPLRSVPRGPWICEACQGVHTVQLPRDIMDDHAVLDYLAGGRKLPPYVASPTEGKRIQRRAANYYFATDDFPIEWTDCEVPLMRKATGELPPRVVPWKEDRVDIIQEMHDTNGHYGVGRTYNLLRERFYWLGMYEAVSSFVRHCPTCQQRNATFVRSVELTPVAVQGAFHTVGIDITGPFMRPGSREKKYIVACIDYLTKWVEASIINNKTAAITAAFFKTEILARHGCPQVLISDNGKEWEGAFAELLQRSGIEHHKTSPHHPQANGLIERLNGTLKMKLQENATLHPQDWEERLTEVLFGYRIGVQASTKYSPFHLVYGRRAVLPMENTLHPQLPAPLLLEGEPPEVQGLHASAKENIERAQKKQKREYENRMQPSAADAALLQRLHAMQPGDMVLVRNRKRAAGKTSTTTIGPFHFVRWDDPQKRKVVLQDGKERQWTEMIRDVTEYKP
jgi:transposase InsO family protein